MKKIFLIIAAILTLLLSGCQANKKTDISALDKRNHHLQTYIKVAFKVRALKGLSSYKEWTRRSEEIGRMIGGFISSVYDGSAAEGNTANRRQKSSGSGNSHYRYRR